MLRRLFTATSVLSLLLCVAAGLLLIESYRNPRTVQHNHFLGWSQAGGFSRIRHIWVRLAAGRVEAHYGELRHFAWNPPDAAEVEMWNQRRFTPPRYVFGPPGWMRVGFVWQMDPQSEGISAYWGTVPRVRRAGVPLWAVIVVTGPLPITWLAAVWRRKRRTLQGLCTTCGYDLRASKNYCPECGTPIPTTMGATA